MLSLEASVNVTAASAGTGPKTIFRRSKRQPLMADSAIFLIVFIEIAPYVVFPVKKSGLVFNFGKRIRDVCQAYHMLLKPLSFAYPGIGKGRR